MTAGPLRGCAFAAAFVAVAWVAPPSAARPPETLSYFVDEGPAASGYRAPDRELARWALEAWAAANGGIRLQAASKDAADIRVYWVAADGNTYGETRPFLAN